MKVKLLGIIITSIITANIAIAAPSSTPAIMSVNLTETTKLTVNNFNSVTDGPTLAALQNPDSLLSSNVVDNADLENFYVTTNYGGGITVTATNNTGNSQSPTGPAVLVNAAGGPNIPYQINYTACGGGPTTDLTTCTGTSGCPIAYAYSSTAACTANQGKGNYTFLSTNGQELGAGTYVGGTNLTFSSGL